MISVGFTDWEFMMTAALEYKLRVEVIPVGLMWYRQLFGKYPRISEYTWKSGNTGRWKDVSYLIILN